MTRQKLLKVLELYDRELADEGVGVREFSESEYRAVDMVQARPWRALAHCRWMCQTAAAAVGGFDPAGEELGKGMRWLGYVQGVVSAVGLYPVSELRSHSRGTDEE